MPTKAHLDKAIRQVQHYLSLMEQRDLAGARALLAPEFRMLFPGGHEFSTLEQLVEFGASRYQFVRKDYEHFDALEDGDMVIVYCYGTLSGEWLDGAGFSDIRFIDRFVLRDGCFTDQRVWNDLAESVLSDTKPDCARPQT